MITKRQIKKVRKKGKRPCVACKRKANELLDLRGQLTDALQRLEKAHAVLAAGKRATAVMSEAYATSLQRAEHLQAQVGREFTMQYSARVNELQRQLAIAQAETQWWKAHAADPVSHEMNPYENSNLPSEPIWG